MYFCLQSCYWNHTHTHARTRAPLPISQNWADTDVNPLTYAFPGLLLSSSGVPLFACSDCVSARLCSDVEAKTKPSCASLICSHRNTNVLTFIVVQSSMDRRMCMLLPRRGNSHLSRPPVPTTNSSTAQYLKQKMPKSALYTFKQCKHPFLTFQTKLLVGKKLGFGISVGRSSFSYTSYPIIGLEVKLVWKGNI